MTLFLVMIILIAIIAFFLLINTIAVTNKKKKDKTVKVQKGKDTLLPPTTYSKQAEQVSVSIDEAILNSPQKFYQKKDSCMTPNESRMFFYINCSLDNIIPAEIRKYYYVFPQVSLYSIISISDKNLSKDELYCAQNNLLRKNSDFLICHCQWQKPKAGSPSKNNSGFYAYSPVLWIELDGSSHLSGQKYGWDNFFKQQRRDVFKDNLAQQLSIPLLRYTLPNDTLSQSDKIQIEAKIASILHIEKRH